MQLSFIPVSFCLFYYLRIDFLAFYFQHTVSVFLVVLPVAIINYNFAGVVKDTSTLTFEDKITFSTAYLFNLTSIDALFCPIVFNIVSWTNGYH